MSKTIYLRMKSSIEGSDLQTIKLKDIVFIATKKTIEKELNNIVIYRLSPQDRNVVVIDGFLIVKHLQKTYNEYNLQLIGPTQTIVRVNRSQKRKSLPLVVFVWLLLFIGMAMSIMHFHYDVNMQEVHQKLHFMLTGEEKEHPLWIQIPYSIGLGIGMVLFFNHWFKKRFNKEPSPLEVELFNYQQNLDEYTNYHENKLNDT